MNYWNFNESIDHFFHFNPLNYRLLNCYFYDLNSLLNNRSLPDCFDLDNLSYDVSNFNNFLYNFRNFHDSILYFDYWNNLFNDSIDWYFLNQDFVLYLWCRVIDWLLDDYFFDFLDFDDFWYLFHHLLDSFNENLHWFNHLNYFLCRNNFLNLDEHFLIFRYLHDYFFFHFAHFLDLYDFLYYFFHFNNFWDLSDNFNNIFNYLWNLNDLFHDFRHLN